MYFHTINNLHWLPGFCTLSLPLTAGAFRGPQAVCYKPPKHDSPLIHLSEKPRIDLLLPVGLPNRVHLPRRLNRRLFTMCAFSWYMWVSQSPVWLFKSPLITTRRQTQTKTELKVKTFSTTPAISVFSARWRIISQRTSFLMQPSLASWG